MEYLDRNCAHHRKTPNTASTSSELFTSYTSHHLPSSSSMKISKSILNPGRPRDPPISLSTSLSRRLRTNKSIKGGQAFPMFGKKRACASENPEPSSPKVTCIGQVRVKTKKKIKQTRNLSRRQNGEVNFRKVERSPNDELSLHFQKQECLLQKNQRWVHFPVTICEAVRAFGAEFSCLFPCRSSCFSSNEKEKAEERKEGNNVNNHGQSSCGGVFARWFVAFQDCEGGKGNEIELVVGGGDEEVRGRISMRSSRRHVFEDIEFKEEKIEVKGEDEEGEEEKGRLSICTPPKDALLLMRCRSDPSKMASLGNRLWDSPAPKVDEEGEVEEDGEANKGLEELLVKDSEIVNDDAENEGKEAIFGNEMQEILGQEEAEEEKLNRSEKLKESRDLHSFEDHIDQDLIMMMIQDGHKDEEEESMPKTLLEEEENEGKTENKTILFDEEESPQENPTLSISQSCNNAEIAHKTTCGKESQELQKDQDDDDEDNKENSLPDCLLLMMREPKLSMEVSKETWVCRKDFLRWLPERPAAVGVQKNEVLLVNLLDEAHQKNKNKKVSCTVSNYPPPLPGPVPPPRQIMSQQRKRQEEVILPPRSSCSLPAAAVASMIQQKLMNAGAYEPFVLTRCKSEPMRTAAAKLLREA